MFDASALRPMLATLAEPPLRDTRLVYEPKYDGIRAIVLIEPDPAGARVRFWSRNGNDKTRQFPEIVRALQAWAAVIPDVLVLDGEIVALDDELRPAGFQRLQHRIHVQAPGYSSSKRILPPDEQPAALIAFDLLREGGDPRVGKRTSLLGSTRVSRDGDRWSVSRRGDADVVHQTLRAAREPEILDSDIGDSPRLCDCHVSFRL